MRMKLTMDLLRDSQGYHDHLPLAYGDHFDQVVENSLCRDLPIITTPHAHAHLTHTEPASDSFTAVHALDFWDSMIVDISTAFPARVPRVKLRVCRGKHVPDGILGAANNFLQAVPPTNGWMVELGYGKAKSGWGEGKGDFECGYRIYISDDTLLVSDLASIPHHYTHAGKAIDPMLIHLGGTTIPGPSMPLLMVTMDAKQGIELVKLVQPDMTIPIHYDDYDVFMSPLKNFKEEVSKAGLEEQVVYLERGEEFRFSVRGDKQSHL